MSNSEDNKNIGQPQKTTLAVLRPPEDKDNPNIKKIRKKYHKAEYVQGRVRSRNGQVLFVLEIVLIIEVNLNF